MQETLIYLATVLPVIFLLIMVYYVDRFREPPRFIVGTFFLGVGIAFPLHFFIIIVEKIIGPLVSIDPESLGSYQMFFRAAYLEESLKFAFLIYFCARLTELDEPMDPIIYGAALGLGYAGYENIPYIFSMEDYASMWEMVVKRVFPTIMHLGVGIIMGTFISMNLFRQWDEFKRRLYIVLALMIPVVLHGMYNHFIQEYVMTVLLFIITIVTILYYHRREQDKKIVEREDRLRIANKDVIISYASTLVLVAFIIIVSNYR